MKREIYMDYAEILENARKLIYEKCKVCADCNGVACRGQVPDAVLICRPYIVAVYGGGAEGVKIYTEKLGNELRETMIMTGCRELKDINENKVTVTGTPE
ncbi:MAG: alpha-hydroxy-acid oxidizing protein [Candidatus Alkaliphilus sp. MAG34]